MQKKIKRILSVDKFDNINNNNKPSLNKHSNDNTFFRAFNEFHILFTIEKNVDLNKYWMCVFYVRSTKYPSRNRQ